MYETTVEIFSDASNAAVMRHPGRKYPGVLLQGDTLHTWRRELEQALSSLPQDQDVEAAEGLREFIGRLRKLEIHYKQVLQDHGIRLPFHDNG